MPTPLAGTYPSSARRSLSISNPSSLLAGEGPGSTGIYDADIELARNPVQRSSSGFSASRSVRSNSKSRPPSIQIERRTPERNQLLAAPEDFELSDDDDIDDLDEESRLFADRRDRATYPDGQEGMPSKKRGKGKPPASDGSASVPPASDDLTEASGLNGHSTGAMNNNIVEHRRKHVVLESPSTASQASHLISRDSFSLDEDPQTPQTPVASSNGFFELSPSDKSNFLMLVLLYFLQGVPMGLAGGSVPFLLKDHLSYGAIGIFSLASYPYSMKLLWSPIVDAIWSQRLGRRKSWILPVQTCSALGMLWLGSRVEDMMETAGKGGESAVWGFTAWWFFLVFTCATQDIAVDGWAITVISPENLAYASTAQTVGLTAGQFLSYTVFLAFYDADFSNRWFRSKDQETGLMTLGGYLTFWGWMYLAVTLGLAVLKRENKTKNTEGVWDVYKVMGGILKLKNIQTFIIVHLISKIGFQANDAVTNLKLIEKGFTKEELALTVLIDFPFEISLGYYAGKWSSVYPPMHLWCWAFVGRLVAAVFAQFVVMIFPATEGPGVPTWYLLTVIFEHVFSTFMNTVMFVAVSAFHAKIADPVIGGTYMTLLATVSNLGGTFPRYFVLKFVDVLTDATCVPPLKPSAQVKEADLFSKAFDCVLEVDKKKCAAGEGVCNVKWDGFYIVNVFCVLFGVLTFFGYIKPAVMRLQALPLKAWRLVGR